MSKWILSAAILLFAVSAYAGDSVWEQQENGTASAFDAKIERLDLDGLRVTYTKIEAGEAPVNSAAKLCTKDRAVNGNFYTEADRALAIHLRVQRLREAKKAGEVVRLAIRGPWSPCIYPVEI